MAVEDYKKNRKARLQRLSEALDNLPELTDSKAHIEVDAVTGGAKAESEERKKQVKDSFKEKNKETREFIKKQDKDREVDKEEKSENRLMLDESLFTETVDMTPDFNPRDLMHKMWALSDAFYELTEYIEENNVDVDDFFTTNYPFDLSFDEVASQVSYWCDTAQEILGKEYGEDFWESVKSKGGKKLNESLYSDAIDVVYDLVDRAKSWIDDGDDKDEAIQHAIDDGLIYSDDIFALARYFGGIDDSELIESFYESLYELMYEKLGDYGKDDEEEDEEEEE